MISRVSTTEPELIQVPLPGFRLSALSWGPTSGPLVVALHGFPDTAWTWRHLGPYLAREGYRVVSPFLRGYAPSEVPPDGCYAVGALMADAIALHAALGGDDRAALVGHDWGAITANALGANPRSPYARIVSMAVPPLELVDVRNPLVLLRQLRMSWYLGFNQLPLLPERLAEPLVRKLWRDWSPGYDAGQDVAHVLDALAGRANRAAAVGYYRALRTPWRVPPAYADLQGTWTGVPTVPTHYLHGADDGCLQVALAERAIARMAGAITGGIVPGAGHFLQVEQPDVVNEAVAAHLAR